MPLVRTTIALAFRGALAIAVILPQSAADATGHDAPIAGLNGIAWFSDEDIAPCPEPLQQRIAARRMRQSFPDPGRCLLVAEANALSFASARLVPYRLAR
jgi:hypothetical protein